MIKFLMLAWLIISEFFLVVSLIWWGMAWVFATEMTSSFLIFVSTYPLFLILSIIISWVTFFKKRYMKSFLWSLFPLLWFFILSIWITV
ncbi:hypothetical protein BTO28_09525 [Domibacillus epiphyticus]|uniref:Uncharacterized protein n=1 Tax=Domibacillus epiphyticus TaxID=1714355 RepID=A0A1V2A7I9_9BACI|nr:hypothetical protein BTO28_09525 [Domibacillus epiphyticus]